MLERSLKKSGRRLSILGFGCMRLPETPDGHIDEKTATAMVHYAIDNGVNYFDTGYTYHNGESEPFLGRALRGGFRDRINIATKLPVWKVESREDMDRYLDEQLERLRTDHIDFYLLHGLGRRLWEKMLDLGVTGFLDDAIADGRICHAGFSFHDSERVFREIVDSYDWTFCQIQYNVMDTEYQAGTAGLRYASERGLGVVVMEPLRGGLLAKTMPEADAVRSASGFHGTAAEWGLRWVWDHPEVTVVLSGMSTHEQVRQNVLYADKGQSNMLTDRELAVYDEIRSIYRERYRVPCTQCGYCMPCPSGVDIPACLAIYNDAFIYDDRDTARFVYRVFSRSGGDAARCRDCGVCEELCPQHISIRRVLEDERELLEE
jgi:predicted aldo/keto reductase-like oxidoreductase